jgi:plasmid stabilization system protein ParE
MTTLRWTLQAVEDLEAIRAYVARDSEHYAALLVERLFAAVDRLGGLPESGRMVPEFQRTDLRELIVGSYRIVYRLGDDSVAVLTVFHGARLFPEGLRGG